LFYLRRAVSRPEFAQIPDVTKCMCLNNLGKRLEVAGRCVEALDNWHRVLEIIPSFGMSLCNRAKVLAHYADAFDDADLRALFLWAAHTDASAAIASTAIYTAARDAGARELAKGLKDWIESFVDIKGIDGVNPLAQETRRIEPEERDYVLWCVKNCLYLNPINDLGPYTLAASDTLALVTHVVPVDAPYTFESFFDQMKQEYVSARWLLYEGLMLASPHFSDREVLLSAAQPRPSLSLSTEKLKAAFRISYSLFDKVSFFINAYMGLGIPEKSVSFRTLWKTQEKKPIRPQFDSTTNWGFCALYWLAKDFFEKPSDDVAEPHARALCDMRNHIEHKYLRVTVAETATAPTDDLALTVSRERFGRDALHVLKLARSALIYLDISVRYEEQRREPDRASLALEEIPAAPYLTDAEKF
jgi:HEPN superfamily protein